MRRRCQGKHRRYVAKIDGPQIAFHSLDGMPHQTARNRRVQWPQFIRTQEYRGRFNCDELHGDAINILIPVGFFLASPIGSMGEYAIDGRIPLPPQIGQQFVSNPVPGEMEVRVRCILPPGDVPLAQVAFDLAPLDFDQWADKTLGRHWPDSGQARRTRTAQKAKQDRFSLVGTRVPEGDSIYPAAAEKLREKPTTLLTRGLLQVLP